ncbi:MAG: hypothetical protein EA405_09370 [Rhodospirillales bacterium]|nr:MAG: hypothetical protein EA405_09370 [Rhodospirillales bacterium]
MNGLRHHQIESSADAAPTLLSSHAECVAKVREHVYGAMRLDPEQVAQDDKCELGCWLRGAAARLRHRPEYWRATVAHANFHKCAADIVRMANDGRRIDAERDLASGGRLRMASKALVESVSALKQILRDETDAGRDGTPFDFLQWPVRLAMQWQGQGIPGPAEGDRRRV